MNATSAGVAPGPLPEDLDREDRERLAPPAALVIFGASGDLTRRKLIPALKRLALRRELPRTFGVVGASTTWPPHPQPSPRSSPRWAGTA